jgi:uncharacterized protein (DUF433 family)
MNLNELIQIDPAICHGKPLIRDNRVPVSIILGSLAVGMSMAAIEEEYGVATADIQAALLFTNDLIAQESFHPLPRVA